MVAVPLSQAHEPPERLALEEVVELLDLATEALGFDFPPQVVRATGIVGDRHTWEFELVPTADLSVSTWLMGYTAPAGCWAIGGLTGGWTAPGAYDTHEAPRGRFRGRPSSHPDARRLRSLVLVGRSGHMAGRVHITDGRTVDEAPESGVAVDAMRRSLGLPTAPPVMPVAELLTSLWLGDVEAVADAARRSGRALSWSAVARLHPALRLLESAGERPRPADLVDLAAALGRVFTWSEVRRHVCDRGWLCEIVGADMAHWMDEGMLARLLVSSFPPIGVLQASATRRLRPAVATRLADAVARLHPDP